MGCIQSSPFGNAELPAKKRKNCIFSKVFKSKLFFLLTNPLQHLGALQGRDQQTKQNVNTSELAVNRPISMIEGQDWTNVQGPVREMIVAITRAIKEQSSDMARILTRMDDFMPRDATLEKLYSREEGERLESNKATVQCVKTLEHKLDLANSQIAKLAHVVEYQTTAISDLNTRLERSQRQVDDHQGRLLHPDYTELYAYVDRAEASLQRDLQQVRNGVPTGGIPESVATAINTLQEDVASTLDSVGAALSRRLESQNSSLDAAFQIAQDSLDKQLQAAQTQLGGSAAHSDKALKALAAELAREQSKVTALEEKVKGVGQHVQTVQSDMDKQLQAKLRRFHVECVAEARAGLLGREDVRGLVESALGQRQYGDVTQAQLQRALQDVHTSGAADASKERDLLLREVQLQQAHALRDWQQQLGSRIDSFTKAQDSYRHEVEAERHRMSELAAEVTRSLSKKANQSEVRALVRGVEKKGHGWGPADGAGAASAASAEAVSELQDQMTEVRAELSRVKKSTSQDVSQMRALMHEKLDSAKVEGVIADVLEQATGRSIPRASVPEGQELSELRYNWHGTFNNAIVPPNVDWRVALGELGMSLRRELGSKLSREECRAAVLEETQPSTRALHDLRRELDSKAEQGDFSKVVNSLEALSSRVVSELTGGLWLWTSRQLASSTGDSRIPWDAQVVNAAPSSLLWRKGSTEITVKLPGLYRIGLAVFTSLPVSLTVCLNGEPILVLGPDAAPDRLSSFANAQGLREERYLLRRLRHSAGDTTAVSLDEPVSLPANSVLSVTYQSAVASQAYLSLRKL